MSQTKKQKLRRKTKVKLKRKGHPVTYSATRRQGAKSSQSRDWPSERSTFFGYQN